MTARSSTGTVLVILTLTGCAGEQFSLGSSAPAPAPIDATMVGRWILSAPNSPSCGLEFNGAPSARAGSVTPDGGCPGNFYMSRRWAMEGDALSITSEENQPVAQFKSAGTHFEGQSSAGTAVKLSR
ncbi:MAG TPA: AprI/Inh family metalloprotease inhibitor [Pseudolabrys sp.]|nr:AprI/Inh family metalloprotease inhibitor [Pseudolabrys sp.]